jgi:hypothetical protein
MRTSPTLAALLLFASPAFAGDGTFEITKTDTVMPVGRKATASVTVTSKKGWHLNLDAPFTLKLNPPPGVAVDKHKLGRTDLATSSETSARFDVGVTMSEPGKKLIAAELGFVLCRKDSCRPIREKLNFTAEASAPPPKPAKKSKKAS